ncbi:MAG: RidA family protein [bacterium]|jgi:enamine deaminase RidA (YjgF/YER057c/UK114 family)
MSEIRRYSTGNVWEESVGFSRAVRIGNTILTAGTVAADETGKIHGSDCYAQCVYIFRKLEKALAALGGNFGDVVKTTCFLVDLKDSEGFTRAHGEIFGEIRPVATCVQVAGLFGEGALAEIELVAVVREA